MEQNNAALEKSVALVRSISTFTTNVSFYLNAWLLLLVHKQILLKKISYNYDIIGPELKLLIYQKSPEKSQVNANHCFSKFCWAKNFS